MKRLIFLYVILVSICSCSSSDENEQYEMFSTEYMSIDASMSYDLEFIDYGDMLDKINNVVEYTYNDKDTLFLSRTSSNGVNGRRTLKLKNGLAILSITENNLGGDSVFVKCNQRTYTYRTGTYSQNIIVSPNAISFDGNKIMTLENNRITIYTKTNETIVKPYVKCSKTLVYELVRNGNELKNSDYSFTIQQNGNICNLIMTEPEYKDLGKLVRE